MTQEILRILLVEDNPGDARLVRETLLAEAPEIEIVWHDRLEPALAEAAAGAVDAVLLDLMLPDSVGLATVTRLLAAAPELPVVVLTGAASDEALAVRAVRAGAQDFVGKDTLASASLLRRLRYAIERKRAEHALLARRMAAAPAPAAQTSEAVLGGRYRLDRSLGAGTSGEAFLAQDATLSRSVVVKLLHTQRLDRAGASDDFLAEARVAASLSHPNLVSVYDFGYHAQRPYFVMEYLPGGPLSARLAREGPLRVPVAVRLACDVLAGLSYMHERGVVHRDVKPANVLLSGNDPGAVAKLGDFGLSRSPFATYEGLGAPFFVGTPAYMAPELAGGEPATVASDVYAAAAVLHEMLGGSPPHDLRGLSPQEVRRALQREPTWKLPADAPAALRNALADALATKPADRPESAAALRKALRALKATPDETRARSGPRR
ncbi:MAG TPA: protein kinase [Candidatus Thermoplasmatota archaeon]|nr:protein kinase [Candidatus Thermoplasmatota archaeon]